MRISWLTGTNSSYGNNYKGILLIQHSKKRPPEEVHTHTNCHNEPNNLVFVCLRERAQAAVIIGDRVAYVRAWECACVRVCVRVFACACHSKLVCAYIQVTQYQGTYKHVLSITGSPIILLVDIHHQEKLVYVCLHLHQDWSHIVWEVIFYLPAEQRSEKNFKLTFAFHFIQPIN